MGLVAAALTHMGWGLPTPEQLDACSNLVRGRRLRIAPLRSPPAATRPARPAAQAPEPAVKPSPGRSRLSGAQVGLSTVGTSAAYTVQYYRGKLLYTPGGAVSSVLDATRPPATAAAAAPRLKSAGDEEDGRGRREGGGRS